MPEVLLTDRNVSYEESEQYFANISLWAQNNCPSYTGYHVQDVSDFSYEYDQVAAYRFGTVKDVNWFKLRWLS